MPGPGRFPAPGRSIERPGVVSALLVVLLALAACEGGGLGGGPPVIELGGDSVVELERGTEIHELRLAATGEAAGISPDSVAARVGDVVRFTVADDVTHAVGFDEAALPPEARAFLERTHQLRSPPLVAKGNSWIVSLAGAPPGVYPIVSLSHEARARLVVRGGTR